MAAARRSAALRVPYHDGVPDQDVLQQAIDGWVEGYGIPADHDLL